ncbi:nuclear transport factor 2 family protein [Glaciecola sp. 33A]|jgi:hypothetical protein|uniref:nuclear transport factor 2 family protein n=1 Tax=Glaciecola sp. 33A TaxID=2057807 RepID=UPI000C34ED86|nr:nuclear transport factor 2 family protein [Glaciecola sp. 33A]PKI03035.1 hypothetical protein CXF81_03430 [Glaciecola sp. 33A]
MQRFMIGLLFTLFLASWASSVLSSIDNDKANLSSEKQMIGELVDGLHDSARRADLTGYLGAFTQSGVFMGTDDWERWTRPKTLDAYVKERFKEGVGWTYKSVERHINMTQSQDFAWFDEIIVSEKWGRFRGTGVVVKEQDNWKITHYSMSVLVANEAFFDIAEINKKAFKSRDKTDSKN